MKNECSIVRDLLPLYSEDMVSTDTAAFIEEHLKNCEACMNEYERTKDPKPIQNSNDAAPLKNLSRKMKIKKINIIAMTTVFVVLFAVSVFVKLTAPSYLPYSEGIVTLEKYGDKGIILNFDESVTDFDYRVYDDPDDSSICYCDIEAWTTIWDRWFSKRNENLSAVVAGRNKPMFISYVPNDESENICIAKYDPYAENQIETDVDTEHVITLPRLTLGYYLIFAVSAMAIMIIVWFVTRKKKQIRIWVERFGLYPAAYIISHFIISGICWATNSLTRDFFSIILLSVLLYGGLLLAQNIWYIRKENFYNS